jgi:hypothetical protein
MILSGPAKDESVLKATIRILELLATKKRESGVSSEKVCHICLPEQCDLFREGVCWGMAVDGKDAVAKASMRTLERLARKEPS